MNNINNENISSSEVFTSIPEIPVSEKALHFCDALLKSYVSKMVNDNNFYCIPEESMIGVDKFVDLIINPMRVLPNTEQSMQIFAELDLKNHPQFHEINNTINIIMTNGAKHISQELILDPKLRKNIRNCLTFQLQQNKFEMTDFSFNKTTNKINWPKTKMDINSLLNHEDCIKVFMNTFSEIIFYMGEENFDLFLKLMNINSKFLILILLIKFPLFLLRTIPLGMLNKVSIMELTHLIGVAFIEVGDSFDNYYYLNKIEKLTKNPNNINDATNNTTTDTNTTNSTTNNNTNKETNEIKTKKFEVNTIVLYILRFLYIYIIKVILIFIIFCIFFKNPFL